MHQDLKASSSGEEVLTDHYMILNTLGIGSFAEVKLACHLRTEVPVALKIMDKDKKKDALITNEVNIMKLLNHPNIIKLFHVMETTQHIFMVMELASGGDLAGHIVEVGSMQEEEAQHIFTQMVCAVKYCHENSIAHRDIKPDNILLDGKGSIKLCDFGLAIKVTAGQKLKMFCGTLPYCAPELFNGQEYDPKTPDIWSMGVVLYLMVTGYLPFKATTYKDMKVEMEDPHYYIPPKLPEHIINLIVKLFTIDSEQRPKIHDIMKHLWLKDSEELLKLSSSPEMLPSKPNINIVTAMWVMGYSPKDIRDSLHEKKFNNIMATYLILKHQSFLGRNIHHQIKPVQFSVASTPSCLPRAHLPLRRTGSEPALPTYTFLTKHQFHANDKIAMKKGSRRLSMPDILWCQQKKTLFPKGAPECDPVVALLMRSSFQKRHMTSKVVALGSTSSENILSRNHIAQIATQSETNLKNSSSPQNTSSVMSSRETAQGVTTTGTHNKERSSFLCETSEPNSSGAQPQSVITASSHNIREYWKRVKRRLVNCFQSLCCCLCPQRRSNVSQKKVAPIEGDGNGVTQNQVGGGQKYTSLF
ncbi:Sperm motility kinase X [Cricetulus griseus]|uniref:non-specific serine/threonine protein kinase n=1 Tax=Cricetulus griseus TaxID=10029 RepID=G3HN35_CRIGR|nr:Sperm motility kinase X [Cricetulus griseus]